MYLFNTLRCHYCHPNIYLSFVFVLRSACVSLSVCVESLMPGIQPEKYSHILHLERNEQLVYRLSEQTYKKRLLEKAQQTNNERMHD